MLARKDSGQVSVTKHAHSEMVTLHTIMFALPKIIISIVVELQIRCDMHRHHTHYNKNCACLINTLYTLDWLKKRAIHYHTMEVCRGHGSKDALLTRL
jgi:hypothetical protein